MGRQSARRTVRQSPRDARARSRARDRARTLTGEAFVPFARCVRSHLTQRHRYAHSLRVARLAARLARRHGEAPERARTAGMLHDIARLYPAERLLAECAARDLPVDAFERANPVVLHARLGAEIARDAFGVTDRGVLDAIRHHTLGAPRMTRLDAIVYLADALEPGRDFDRRPEFLDVAFDDLDAGMAVVLRSTLAYLRGRNLAPAPQTLAAFTDYERHERSKRSA